MSDASILKEFLVGIGFKVDQASFEKFQKGLGGATTQSVALGEIIAKVAEVVAQAVLKMATDLDELYFTSRRVNAAAENVKAFGFAIQQLGGTAQGAQSALEGVASFMRSNPAGERFIQGMGVATRDANGQLRDTEAILEDLGKQFSQMPFYMAKVRAAMLGIDERTLIALEQGVGAETDKYRDFAARLGLGMDGGADAANRFGEKMRDLQAEFGLIMIAVTSKFLPLMQDVVDWVSKLPFQIEAFKRTQFGQSLTQAATAGGHLWDALVKLVTAFLHLQIVGGAVNLLLGVAKTTFTIIAGLLNTIADLLQGKWKDAWNDAKGVVKDVVGYILGMVKSAVRAVEELWYAATHHGEAMPGGDQPIDTAPAPGTAPPVAGTLGAPGANPEGSANGSSPPIIVPRGSGADGSRSRSLATATGAALGMVAVQVQGFFEAHGLSASKAQGIAAGVQAEGGTPTAFNGAGGGHGAFGIGQWRGARLAELRRRYGNTPTLGQQLEFMLWEFMGGDKGGASVLAAGGAADTLRAYILDFMRPGSGALGDLDRGSRYLQGQVVHHHHHTSVSQKTEVNVHGVSDPHAAGRVVTAAQDRVNGGLVRNLKTAVA